MTSPPAYATTGRDSTAACAPCGKGDVLVGWNPQQAVHRRRVRHLRQIRRQLFDRRREHAAAIRHGTRSNLHPAPRARHPPRRILQPHRIRPHGRCRHTRAGSPGHTAAGHRTSAAASRRDQQPPAPSGPQTMTDDKTDVPCPTRTLAVRSDGTIVRGLAATRTEARRWLEAVQTHGRRTALAQVALAATTPTTPATPGEGHKGTTVSALRDPLILSRESIRRNRSVEQTSPTGWTLHNVARLG